MKQKILAGILAFALTCTSALQFIPGETYAADSKSDVGTTYYVSSLDGDDENDGMSENEAFATLDKINEITLGPGDEVLLERGSVFEDQYLHVKGSGAENEPIIISAYGEGDMPQINANGTGVWYQDFGKALDNQQHKYKGNVSSAILLNDVEYIEISDLEITNDREKGINEADKGLAYNDLNVMDRTGVAGYTRNIGTADHIVLDNLYIHDVDGNVYNKHMLNGGIYFISAVPENETQTGISKYDDVQIKNCRIETVNRWGIALSYTSNWDKFKTKAISDEICEKYGSTNIVIENNYIKDAGGDSITTMYCFRPIVQNNVSEGAARQINTKDYSKTTFGRVAAAIWPWKCKDAVFQYNECFNTQNAASGNGDGQAWDADWGDGTLYQYNYSHGNTGGAVMFCGEQAYRNTFRYNISQEDLLGVLNLPSQPDAHVYNNTFYMKENVNFIRQSGMAYNGKTTVENNIFYYAGETARTENWNPGGNTTYDNNLYYNYANVPTSDENAVKVTKGTVVMVDPGKAPTTSSLKVNRHDDPDEESVFDGYKLVKDSPAWNAGKIIEDENGKEVELDFFGRKVGAVPEIGAAESDQVSLALRSEVYDIVENEISGLKSNTTVKEFISNLIYDEGVKLTVKDKDQTLEDNDIVTSGMDLVLTTGDESVTYHIVPNKDNELKSTVYMMKDKTIYIPSTEENPATVKEIKAGVTVDNTANVSIWDNDQEVKEGNVENGMTLKITAENGDVNTYTIEIKNTYQWALDYAGAVQGNVWFAQIRKSADVYENLTDYDPTYPNWVVDTWYGPGVDLPNHTAVPSEATHGLLSDTNGATASEGMAMAFRAPREGYVSFKVKDDEPYLRQDGNSGGTVEIKLTVNGETKQSCVLEQSKVQGDFPEVAKIKVEKGDYIRVEAKNNNTPSKGSVHVTPTIEYLNIALDDPDVEPTDISTTVLKYAIELAGKASTEDLIPIIANEFATRLAAANEIIDKVENGDKDVTQEQVDNAWKALIEIMQYLEFKQGDKTELENAISIAESLDLDDYEEDEKMETFLSALEEARKVRDDENAMQKEIDDATEALISATAELTRKMVDKTDLNKVIEWTSALDLDKYLDIGKKEFNAALEAAIGVAKNDKATQEQVDGAWKDLMDAASALRLKPDKSELEELLNTAVTYMANESEYETTVFGAFRKAYAAATAIFEDEQATGEEVRVAVADLENAMAKLDHTADNTNAKVDTAIVAAAGTSEIAEDKSDTVKSAKTGDAENMTIPILAAMTAAVIGLMVKRKRG